MKIVWEVSDVRPGLLVWRPAMGTHSVVVCHNGVTREGARWGFLKVHSVETSIGANTGMMSRVKDLCILDKTEVARILNEGEYLPAALEAEIAAARRKQSGENPVSKEAIWTNYEKGAFSACNAPEDRA